ncbi:MAG: LemA family protein [Actinomycetes bacterium]
MTWVWIVLVVLVVIVGLWFAATYNSLIRLRNIVEESWKQIDVELHRRYDLIPNLVETVKGYASHERGTFEAVTQARAAASTPGSTPAEQAQQENMLTGALRQLFAVAEAYPDLKANQNFLELQKQLTETEDRIAAGRRFYNANVRAFNTKIQSVPSNLVANMFSFKEAEYFEVDDPNIRSAPQVQF